MARKDPHAVALGTKGGKVTSPAKAAAARVNGAAANQARYCTCGDKVSRHYWNGSRRCKDCGCLALVVVGS